jgi:hypothetical protein
MQTSLCHEAQEPDRLERGCFAPRIWSRDHQGAIVWTEADIDGDGRGEQRMADGEELQATFLRQVRGDALHALTQPPLGRDKVDLSQES